MAVRKRGDADRLPQKGHVREAETGGGLGTASTIEAGTGPPKPPKGASTAHALILDFQPQSWERTRPLSSPRPVLMGYSSPCKAAHGTPRKAPSAAGTQPSAQHKALQTVPESHSPSLGEPGGAHPSRRALEESVCPKR